MGAHGAARLRAKLAIDPALTTVVLREFIAAVSAWLRRRARRLGIRGPLKTGAVTVIQRFNSALDVAPHFHTPVHGWRLHVPSGRSLCSIPCPVAQGRGHGSGRGRGVPPRGTQARRGGAGCRAEGNSLEAAPLLVALAEASAQGVIATGPRRGCRVVRVRGVAADVDAFVMGRLCAQVEGYNLQAATRIAANDRDGLERMGRYLARPPVATERLSQLEDGRLELRLKRPWRDGTIAFRYTPHELIERLVAIVPRPRANLARYNGVLAPAFAADPKSCRRRQTRPAAPPGRPPVPPGAEAPKRPGRFPWASLIWRVFLEDVLACARCRDAWRSWRP